MRTNTAPYCPLFDIKTHKPIHAYYSLVAFNQLYKLGKQIETKCSNDRLYTLAASDGTRYAIMLANLTGGNQPLCIKGIDLSNAKFYVLGESGQLAWTPNADVIENNAVVLIEA